jgi:hypothetical protein
VKPIDYTYFQSLKNCIAKRLYEFLGIKFYGLRKKREKFFRIGYLNLYQLLPITPQKSFSLIKKNLDPAHNELIQTGFLAEVEYEITKDRNSFNILYFPGERAIREMRGDWGAEIPELEAGQPLEIEAPKERTISEKSFLDESQSYDMELQYKEEMSPLVKELLNRGITKSVAVDFAKSFSEEHLREKIEIHDYKKEAGELNTNAAGWLREAIVCDYKPSEEQLKKQAKLLEKQAQQEEQRTLEEKAREIQETRLAEALASFPLDEKWVRERVMEHVNVRETTIKAFGGEQFTEAEIAEMYLRYQSQIPKTDEEKRGWLISYHREYVLSAIIEELKKEQQKSQKEGSTGTINERLPCNSIGDVLAEVARQKAEFEAKQNGIEQEEK